MRAKYYTKLVAVFSCIALVGLFWVLMVKGVRIEKYRDNKVEVGEIRRAWDLLAVHQSRPQYLAIDGKTFHGVRGMAPYYLNVLVTNAILFVTQTPEDRITIHVFNLTTKEDIQIDGGTSGFGRHLGGPRSPGGQFTDYIESADSNHITVVKRVDDWIERLVLNLDTKAVESEEIVYFDARDRE